MLLPELDGFSVLEQARAAGVTTPILHAHRARRGPRSRATGCSRGADDYLVKPFAFAELLARLDALTPPRRARRERAARPATWRSTARAQRVTRRRRARSSSRHKQFALLEFLLRHRGQVVTRAMVLEQVFGYALRSRHQHRRRAHRPTCARRSIGRGAPSRIATVRGVGYRLESA